MTCQAGPGLTPTLVPPITPVPFISHTAAVPSTFCHRMSALPSPLKSPAPIACQADPGLEATFAPAIRLLPFMNHSATVPLLFCQRMSALPSPLKSPEPISCQSEPGLIPTLDPEISLVPSVNQIAGVPSRFCHRISLWPLPLVSLTRGRGRLITVVASALRLLDAAPSLTCHSMVCAPSRPTLVVSNVTCSSAWA